MGGDTHTSMVAAIHQKMVRDIPSMVTIASVTVAAIPVFGPMAPLVGGLMGATVHALRNDKLAIERALTDIMEGGEEKCAKFIEAIAHRLEPDNYRERELKMVSRWFDHGWSNRVVEEVEKHIDGLLTRQKKKAKSATMN